MRWGRSCPHCRRKGVFRLTMMPDSSSGLGDFLYCLSLRFVSCMLNPYTAGVIRINRNDTTEFFDVLPQHWDQYRKFLSLLSEVLLMLCLLHSVHTRR